MIKLFRFRSYESCQVAESEKEASVYWFMLQISKLRSKLPITSFRDAITSAVESNQVLSYIFFYDIMLPVVISTSRKRIHYIILILNAGYSHIW